MASYVVALRITSTHLVALFYLCRLVGYSTITISHGARTKRIPSLICRKSSMSHHITSHLITCRSAARRTTAICRATRSMSHRITFHRIACSGRAYVSEPLWGSATRCCAPVLGRANPCGEQLLRSCGKEASSRVNSSSACRAKDKPAQELDCDRC
jgi:hypothetical protein